MKKLIVFVCLVGMVTLVATSAMAENIAGRLGITGRIGFLIPTDSDRNDLKLETDAGFVGGGGLIYGINRHLAAEIDVTRSEFGSNTVSGRDTGDFGITDIALGVQYRFDLQATQWVPFVGGGLDILLTDYRLENGVNTSVDNTVGVHLKGGVDYFFLKNMAATAEVKVVETLKRSDFNAPGGINGHFETNSFGTTIGIRYFFN